MYYHPPLHDLARVEYWPLPDSTAQQNARRRIKKGNMAKGKGQKLLSDAVNKADPRCSSGMVTTTKLK